MQKIIPLPRKDWLGYPLPIGYTTEHYYDIVPERTDNGFVVKIELCRFDHPVTHTPEEYDFPDSLYQKHFPGAKAYGIIENGVLIAAIELFPEKWSNRLRVTELWVDPRYQKQELGHALMEKAKSVARRRKSRAIMLETQSCNVDAIGFYLHEGFTLIGFNACEYANNDLERKEVRLELGILLEY